MKLLHRITSLLRNLFRKDRTETDLDNEIGAYVEILTEKNIESGFEPTEARRLALIEFGGKEQVKEKVREISMGHFIETVFQDVRYAARMLAKNRTFTAVSVLTLALGIGANTAIFSVVNGVLLRPLPFREPDRLVRMRHDKPKANQHEIAVSADDILEWRKNARSLESVAAYAQSPWTLTGDFEPEQVMGVSVTNNFFSVLGLQPVLGRTFVDTDDRSNGNNLVVLGYQLWQRRYGGDKSIIGRTIVVNYTNSYSVIGVMPAGVDYPGESQFWQILGLNDQGSHSFRFLSNVARLKPGASIQQASAELDLINEGLQKQHPEIYNDSFVKVLPLHYALVKEVRPALLILLGAVSFVLLIACANVANLLLARSSARQKEIAVRAALGASRLRLIRQMLTESAMLAVMGGACGVLLATWGVKALIALNPPDIPRLDQVTIDSRVLGFTFVVALLVGLLFGLAPALQLSKYDLTTALKGGISASNARGNAIRRQGLRGILVISQTALALVLLVGAGLMIKSFIKLHQVELGFDPRHSIELTLLPSFNRFSSDQHTNDYYQQVMDSINTAPGVVSSAVVTGAPLGGYFGDVAILIDGRLAPDNIDGQRALFTMISPDYFRAAGVPLKQGRFLTGDDSKDRSNFTVINETMARRYFPNENPIGHHISLTSKSKPFDGEIVGVVGDVKQMGLEAENRPNFYVSFRQYEVAFMVFVVRTTGDPSAMIPTIRAKVREADKYAPITRIRTLEQVVSDSAAQPRFYTLLLGLFSGLSILLAAIGLYGVMSYSVSQRTREIGIRLSLGAQPNRILGMVVGQGIVLIAIGVVVGLAAALAFTRVMTGLLFRVSATDPATFSIFVVLLIAIALLATYIPARRASRVDPMISLRYD